MTATLSTEARAELLSAADAGELISLAEDLMASGALADLSVVKAPKTGLVMMQVREPVESERFYLGEVLTTECTVELGGEMGWSMRAGDDRVAVLAAAVLDAVVASGHERSAEVEELCAQIAERRTGREDAEWDEIAPTIVEFEELP